MSYINCLLRGLNHYEIRYGNVSPGMGFGGPLYKLMSGCLLTLDITHCPLPHTKHKKENLLERSIFGCFCRTNKKLKEANQANPITTKTNPESQKESPYVITFQVWSDQNKKNTPSNRPPTNLYQVRKSEELQTSTENVSCSKLMVSFWTAVVFVVTNSKWLCRAPDSSKHTTDLVVVWSYSLWKDKPSPKGIPYISLNVSRYPSSILFCDDIIYIHIQSVLCSFPPT